MNFYSYQTLFLCSIAWLTFTGCDHRLPSGSIHIAAPTAGSYEIYRIESEHPFQFVSEQIGTFNQDIPLNPGQYLILADCSSKTIIVNPETVNYFTAYQTIFKPPAEVTDRDRFSVQCNRFDETRSRQHFTNKYSFTILEGNRDLLVGMVPFRVDAPLADTPSQTTVTYQLSALKVEAFPGMKPQTSFFVSPLDGLIAITEPQEFGHWQFLLPGSYTLQVNGTEMKVDLEKGELRKIEPAFLTVKTSQKAKLELSSQVRGTPIFMELNHDHLLELNEIYPVLPGKAKLSVTDSNKQHSVNLISSQTTTLNARSVIVNFDCSPWEWSCLGSRKIFLYEGDKSYAFAQGVTDVPILFLTDDVTLSIEGSRDIRYLLPKNRQHTSLDIGKVTFSPIPIFRNSQITDLARVEAFSDRSSGHTLDIQFDRVTTMPFVIGSYRFAQYVSYPGPEAERKPFYTTIRIRKNDTTNVKFHVYANEKRCRNYAKH